MESRIDSTVSKNVALLVATMSSFLTPFLSSSVNIALPSIGTEFAMDAVLLSWVATSYILASAMFLVPFGRVADIYGRKKVFICGMLVFTVASVVSAISTSAIMLIAFRVLHGIGSAMIFGTGVAIVTSVFPAGERGKALGIIVASVYLGLSLGPFFGGLLTQHFGWRSVFLVNGPLGLIIIAAVLWKLKGEWAGAKGQKFDFSGSIIYSLSLVAIMYGVSILPALSGIGAIVIGLLGGWVFIWWENRIPSPVLNIDLFRNNVVFAFSNLAALINYCATYAATFLLSLFLQYTKGFSPLDAGLILVSMPAVQTVFAPFAGRLSDRIHPRILASVGMGLTTTGLGLLIFLNENTAIEYILTSLIILGFGFAAFTSPNANAIMSSVEKRSYGVAAATMATMRQIGMVLSMGIAMLIFALLIGRVEITPEYYPVFMKSLKIAFIIFTALCFGGIFASLATGKTR